jgi:SAM-dependent methyltransferase
MVQAPEKRFSDRADDYRKFRPDYPSEVIDEILSRLEFGSHRGLAVDVGAGTGISSKLLASAGWSVIAIEPNAEMRKALEASIEQGIAVRTGTAESTGLSDQSADLVTSFQAFHWFDPAAALKEFHRILKPGAGVALVWNVRSQSDPFTRAYSRIVEKSAEADVRDMVTRKENSGESLLLSPLFEAGAKVSLLHHQELDLPSLIGRVRSVSYLPKEGQEYDRIIGELELLYEQRASGGTVRLMYDVVLYLAQRKS